MARMHRAAQDRNVVAGRLSASCSATASRFFDGGLRSVETPGGPAATSAILVVLSTDRNCGANRAASSWASRFGEGPWRGSMNLRSRSVRVGFRVGPAAFRFGGRRERGRPWQPAGSQAWQGPFAARAGSAGEALLWVRDASPVPAGVAASVVCRRVGQDSWLRARLEFVPSPRSAVDRQPKLALGRRGLWFCRSLRAE
jgi:hypothetical protein